MIVTCIKLNMCCVFLVVNHLKPLIQTGRKNTEYKGLKRGQHREQ